jgi:prophage sa05, DNA-binding protein
MESEKKFSKTLETIAIRLKEKREERKLRLEDVARLADISTVTLHKYENMKTANIPLENIEKLAEIYHTTPSYLLGWSNEDNSDVGRSKMSSIHKDIYNYYLKITSGKDRLKSIRERNGFNEKEYALALEITLDELHKYENGEEEIPLSVIKNIEKWFRVPKEVWLIGDCVSDETKNYIKKVAQEQKDNIEKVVFESMLNILQADGYNINIMFAGTDKEYWQVTSFDLPADVIDITKKDLIDICLSAKNHFIDLLKYYSIGYDRHLSIYSEKHLKF